MKLGFAEPRPKWEWFVVERFSADWRALRNGTMTALNRSTTNLRNAPPHLPYLPNRGLGAVVLVTGRDACANNTN